MEEKRLGEGYCPSCLKTKENCICYKNIAIPLKKKDCDTMKSNCEECKLRDDCSPMYPCELSNKLEEARTQLDNYKAAWSKLKEFVSDLQDAHERHYAYSNQHIESIEDEIEELEKRIQLLKGWRI